MSKLVPSGVNNIELNPKKPDEDEDQIGKHLAMHKRASVTTSMLYDHESDAFGRGRRSFEERTGNPLFRTKSDQKLS